MKRISATIALGATLAVLSGSGIALAAQSVSVTDPVGDISTPGTPTSAGNEKRSGFLDMTQSTLTKEGDTFTMTMRVAEPIPVTPTDPAGTSGLYQWVFAIDSDPNLNLSGYPFPPGLNRFAEYVIFLGWDGTQFFAQVIDRTPLATGGQVIETDIPFSFNAARDELALQVNEALIGDPVTFVMPTFTSIRESHLGAQGIQPVDVPDVAINWP
jgi:hypothetical protein